MVRDVATLQPGIMAGQYDRYNMRRQVTVTANVFGQDLGGVAKQVEAAIKPRASFPPEQRLKCEVRSFRLER